LRKAIKKQAIEEDSDALKRHAKGLELLED
jgi:hypothetical protein